jgi:PAS domain S-box-containing protein
MSMSSNLTKKELKEQVCRLEAEVAALKRSHLIDEDKGLISLKKDHSRVWMEISAVLHRDDSGSPVSFTGISRDITLRKRSEEALRKSEEKYRKILETIEDGFFEVDLAGNFVFYNEAMGRMLGYEGNELIGVHYSTYMSPEQKKAVYKAFNGVYRTGNPYKALDWELIRKDKTICYIETSVSLVLDSQGRPAGFQGIARDVTERRLAERENEKLQARLRHAKQMEAIGRLAGGIAHDFNNILTTVLGYTELSMDEVEKQSLVHQNLSQVMAAGLRAKNLVKQILAVSRREKEGFKPFEVAPFIRDFLQKTARLVPDNIELCKSIPQQEMIINGDPIQLEQMMSNLVKNAVNAMEKKGGVLTVGAEAFASEGAAVMSSSDSPDPDYVKISVSDTGEGIAEEFLDKIFEPYFTNKKEGTGTGLGLSIVHGIVRSHKGHIRVESRPGEGSIFFVHLPLVKGGNEDDRL